MGTEGLLLWTPLLKTKTPSTPDKAKAVPAKSARGHQHISLKSAHMTSTSEPSKHFFCLSLFQRSVYPLSLKQSQILGSLLFPAILAEVLLSPILFCPCLSPLSGSTCCFQEESIMERRGRETEKIVCTLRRGECLV